MFINLDSMFFNKCRMALSQGRDRSNKEKGLSILYTEHGSIIKTGGIGYDLCFVLIGFRRRECKSKGIYNELENERNFSSTFYFYLSSSS